MTKAFPSFSVIIPTYQRPEQLGTCLSALTELDYPSDRFEIIVVDDGSPVSPEPVVASFRDRLNLTLLTQPNSGPASARNTGAAHAKGEFLAAFYQLKGDIGWLLFSIAVLLMLAPGGLFSFPPPWNILYVSLQTVVWIVLLILLLDQARRD